MKEQLTIFFDEKWMGYVKPEERADIPYTRKELHEFRERAEQARANALPVLNPEIIGNVLVVMKGVNEYPFAAEYTWPGTFEIKRTCIYQGNLDACANETCWDLQVCQKSPELKGYILFLPEAQKPEAQKGDSFPEWVKATIQLKSENAKLTALLKEVLPLIESTRLPNSCINNWDEVKFCPHRQGEGNKCEWCFDREYLVNRIEKLLK